MRITHKMLQDKCDELNDYANLPRKDTPELLGQYYLADNASYAIGTPTRRYLLMIRERPFSLNVFGSSTYLTARDLYNRMKALLTGIGIGLRIAEQEQIEELKETERQTIGDANASDTKA